MINDDLEWHKCDGASTEELASIVASVESLVSISEFELPSEYIDFLRYSNGGEGPLSVQPYNFVLYSASEVSDHEMINICKVSFPGYFIIGGDGGGEYIAIEFTTNNIVALDMVNVNISESRLLIAGSFQEFVSLIGAESKDA